MSTFIWAPAPGAGYTCRPTVEPAKFGDGYEARVPIGINTQPKKWSLKFAKYPELVLAFLEARNGAEAFNWVDPFGGNGVYVCREWKPVSTGPRSFEVACDFEQVFEQVSA